MASNTPNLDLLKKDPIVDGQDTFNIKTMLNDNWDKIDEAIGDNTIDDTLDPISDTGLSVRILLSWLANMIKSITGKSSWRIKPTKNLEELNTAINDVNATVGNKVDKVAGKQLSDTNYTIGEKMKLEGMEAGANKYVHPASHTASMITGLPTSLPASGGNANTVGGLAPSAFATAAQGALATNAMPISGATFTGMARAHASTSYTTGQLRDIILSTADASGVAPNGAIWIKYKA